jgi:Family of unknown function (DUF5344)
MIMSQEMKIRYGDVENTVSKIEAAADAFEITLAKDVASGNELDVVAKLNEINNLLEEIGRTYKNVLKDNNQSVLNTLENLKAADQEISSSIKAQ